MRKAGIGFMFKDDEMWEATINCDSAYDGRFFYAVKTVGVYCRPSCKSRTPLRKNVLYFVTSDEAVAAGFRPCKRCRPDLIGYAPLAELARQTKEVIDGYYQERDELTSALKQLGVTPGHLSTVFKQEYSLSPTQYLNQIRLRQSQKLLTETDMSIVDVAGEVGFDSLSAFYAFFKKNLSVSPRKYRKERQETV
jgi:AraC family transcriptional regulator of adaptative response / methylphosphotriester-DNA alkyltransferase methyltransferase